MRAPAFLPPAGAVWVLLEGNCLTLAVGVSDISDGLMCRGVGGMERKEFRVSLNFKYRLFQLTI